MNILIIYPNGNALNPHSGAETRFWNLINSLSHRNYNITVLHSIKSKSLEDKSLVKKCKILYNRNIRFFGLSDFYLTDFNPFFWIKLLQLQKQQFDIIQLEFPWGFFSTKLFSKKRSILIYDSQGIESEFIKIATQNPKFPKVFSPFARIYSKVYEKLVCKLANIIVNVSNVDIDYYVKNYKIDKNKTILIQTPSALNHENIKRTEKLKIESRKKLGLPLDKTIAIFHGSLPHPPNQQAFDLIKNYIAPKIENPDILFVLAGYNVNKFKKKNIVSLGFVKNLKDLLYSADFAIVPLTSGSGMRIKCTDYIITALPFIATKKGIEGIEFVKPDEDYILCEDVNEKFLDSINILSENRELREKIQQNLLRKSYIIDRDKFEKKFVNLYSKLIKI